MSLKRAVVLAHAQASETGPDLWTVVVPLAQPAADLSPAPALRASSGSRLTRRRRRAPSMRGPREFCFLNERGGLDRGWDDESRSKLWLYNLHYFDDLNAEGAASRDAGTSR